MTDNKRFTLAYEKGNWWAVRDWDITLWKEEVIHLLNELNDENEQLKQEKREIIQTILDFCNNDYNGHKESFEDLLEEIGWEEGSWLDKDGNIRDFDEVEWND